MNEIINIDAIDEKYTKHVLPNNLRVYIYSSKELSEYYASFTTYYGSNLDEIPGTAHFLEHSLFTKEDGDIFSKFAANNASCNAFTSNHQTTYYFTSSSQFEENFTLLQKLVNDGYFSEKLVAKEMGIIEEEIAMYAQNSDSKIRNTTLKNTCTTTNYGIDIAGTKKDINQLSPQILKKVHSKYYVPNNQAIVLSGNFEGIDVISLIDQHIDKTVLKEEKIESNHVIEVHNTFEIENLNVDMFTHTYKFEVSESMEENIRDYISLNVYLSTYFSHINQKYLSYKESNKFTSLLENSVMVTPSIKMIYFEMNYEQNENVISEFISENTIDKEDLLKGMIKVKAYEIRQASDKKRLMENVMYSLSDDFEYSDYVDILFSIEVDEIYNRVTKLLANSTEAKLIFVGKKKVQIKSEEVVPMQENIKSAMEKISKIMAFILSCTKIAITKTNDYLKKRFFFRRIFAKLVDLFVIAMFGIIIYIIATAMTYSIVPNVEAIRIDYQFINAYLALILTLIASIFYFTYFSISKKIMRIEKVTENKLFYNEPIIHLLIFVIYGTLIEYFIPFINLSFFVFIFLVVYTASFCTDGGFWNKNATIIRSDK